MVDVPEQLVPQVAFDQSVFVKAAVQGVVASAFGFQGQKCSACSRAIVDAAVYDEFLVELKARTEALRLGSPLDGATDVGPVSSERAMETR